MRLALVVAVFVLYIVVEVDGESYITVKPPTVTKATKCQEEREKMKADIVNGLADAQLPECDGKGRYVAKQCLQRFCQCVNRKTGKPRFDGLLVPFGEKYDCKKKPTQCQREKFKLLIDVTQNGVGIPQGGFPDC